MHTYIHAFIIIYHAHWTDLARVEIKTLKKFTAMPPVAVNGGVGTGKGVQDWVRRERERERERESERERERERARERENYNDILKSEYGEGRACAGLGVRERERERESGREGRAGL
jgi:predicted RNase H-like nuclease (RuvC/YqgF family)